MKGCLKGFVGFIVVLAVISAVAGIVVFTMLNTAKNADTYDFGADQITSVKSVLGMRSIGEMSTSTEDGVTVKSYEYTSKTGAQDVEQYVAYLTENEGVVPDGGVYVKQSADAGKVLKVEIASTQDGFCLTITKE